MKNDHRSISTGELFSRLFKSPTVSSFLEANAEALDLPSFAEHIRSLCRKRGEVPERVILRANIENSYGHQIFAGRRRPSRDLVIQLAFGFEGDVEMAQSLLKHAGRSPLYPRVKRDAAILYCLHNRFSLIDTQLVLHDLDVAVIGEGRR